MKVSMILLTVFISAFAQAQIQPTSEVLAADTGILYAGNYNEDTAALESTYVYEKYDEVVATFANLEAGVYKYRFSSLPKDIVHLSSYGEHGGCNEPVKNSLEALVRTSSKSIERLEVLSSSSTKAEVRLTAALPSQVLSLIPFITEGCNEPGPVAKLKWAAAPRPATDWKQLTMKQDKTLVIRYPAELKDAELELVKIQ